MRHPVILAFFAAAEIFTPAVALDSDVPLMLVTPDNVHLDGGAMGLIPAILSDLFVSKLSAKRIQAFREATVGTDWADKAGVAFSCVGIPQGQTCRTVLRFAGSNRDLLEKLRASGTSSAILVTVVQVLEGGLYRAHANLREIRLDGGDIRVGRAMTAIYAGDAPSALIQDAKKNPKLLKDYWAGGTTPMAAQEGEQSLAEMAAMLNVLIRAVSDEKSPPDGWRDLKGTKELEQSGRIHCHGLCSPTRIYADHVDHLWIAYSQKSGPYGWSLASLNNNAARQNANFLAYVIDPAL
jgi:hypothetical protein